MLHAAPFAFAVVSRWCQKGPTRTPHRVTLLWVRLTFAETEIYLVNPLSASTNRIHLLAGTPPAIDAPSLRWDCRQEDQILRAVLSLLLSLFPQMANFSGG